MSGGDTSSEGKEKLDKGTEYNGHSYTWGSQGRPLGGDGVKSKPVSREGTALRAWKAEAQG